MFWRCSWKAFAARISFSPSQRAHLFIFPLHLVLRSGWLSLSFCCWLRLSGHGWFKQPELDPNSETKGKWTCGKVGSSADGRGGAKFSLLLYYHHYGGSRNETKGNACDLHLWRCWNKSMGRSSRALTFQDKTLCTLWRLFWCLRVDTTNRTGSVLSRRPQRSALGIWTLVRMSADMSVVTAFSCCNWDNWAIYLCSTISTFRLILSLESCSVFKLNNIT